jgi:Cys-tRNA(Pro)/Cys-tRNA(Cys) deacylase
MIVKKGGMLFMDKTNVMRSLDQKKIPYISHSYDPSVVDGVSVALTLGQQEERVFKTLVTVANTGAFFVFAVPVAESLDLKKAAKAAQVKSVAMIKQKELLPLTGYIHGGCSPVGMKKQFKTFIHESAREFATICVSAGRVGFQAELNAMKLAELIGAEFVDLIEGQNPSNCIR